MTDPTETHTEEEFEASLVEHDVWFRHTAKEPHHQDSHGDTKTVVILMFMAATVVAVFGLGLIVLKYFEAEARVLKADMENFTPRKDFDDSIERWNVDLTTYGWADAEAGVVRLPLDQAMAKVRAEYQSNAGETTGR